MVVVITIIPGIFKRKEKEIIICTLQSLKLGKFGRVDYGQLAGKSIREFPGRTEGS